MGEQRVCKRCGAIYYLIVPFSKARKDIRNYCPKCHPYILAQIQEQQKVKESLGDE